MCYLVRSELQRGSTVVGLINGPTGAPGKEPCVLGKRDCTDKRAKPGVAWSCVAVAQACDVGIHERAKTVKSPACWVQSWDTTDSFAPWQAYLIHAAAGAIGVGEEQPRGTPLQRLVLVTSLKCGAAPGVRRLLTVAPLSNSALCVSRFSFPALRHIKALQSRHRTHIVTCYFRCVVNMEYW